MQDRVATDEPSSRDDYAALQDELLIATTDMDRLQALLSDAVEQLAARFIEADSRLSDMAVEAGRQPHAASLAQVREQVGGAVIALQFQDMATQLLAHAMRRVRSVADWLGNEAMPGDGDGLEVQFVVRACPVAQRQMDAGSIELY